MIKYLLALLLIVTPCFGADYYVDQNHGSASDSNDGSENSPWLTPHYGAAQLSAGDTLYIKAGYYYYNTGTRYEPGINPVNSGTAENPITIKAYTGHNVYIMGTANISNPASSMLSPAIGAYKAVTPISYIIIDGFKIYGNATFWRADNCTIQNCELWGGGVYVGGDNWPALLRSEITNDLHVYNNYFHDLEDPQGKYSSYNAPMVMLYDTTDCIIENNEFDTAVDAGVRLKDNCDNVTVRYNFFDGMGRHAVVGGQQGTFTGNAVYQNVVINSEGLVYWRGNMSNTKVYNNTGYALTGNEGYGVIGMSSPTVVEFFNNIIQSNSDYFVHYASGMSSTDCDYMDYNNYYGSSGFRDAWGAAGANLAAWQTYCDGHSKAGANEGDDNSVTSDPGFANAGGDTAVDYKRGSYTANGRGGSYSDVMGAYLVGDESIGLTDGEPPSEGSQAIIGVSIQ